MIGDINLQAVPQEPDIWLARPDGNLVGKIEGRAGIAYSKNKRKKMISHTQLYKVNSVNEMDFSIPFIVERNHVMERNPIIDLIQNGMYLKILHNGLEEWHIIIKVDKSMDDQKDICVVKSRTLSYELAYRQIRNFKVFANNMSSILNGGSTVNSNGDVVSFNGILNGTLWKLDKNYDSIFDTIFRDFTVSQSSILNAIIQLAKTFGAIIQWNSISRTISFIQPKNLGQNKGFRLSYGNYLKTLLHEQNGDDLVTIFRPEGKAGTTISSVSLDGTDVLQDYSYFMKGFSRDSNKNVLSSTNGFMSDSLCGQLLDYQIVLANNQGQYATLLSNLTGYKTTLTTKTNEMNALVVTMNIIKGNLDVALSTNNTANITTYTNQQTSQQALINTKQSEIDAVNANITSTNTSITNLQATLSQSANFSVANINELKRYMRQKDWVDSNIDTPQKLLDQAKIEFAKYKTPSVTIKVDLINFLSMAEESRNWDKLSLGDKIQIEYDVIGTYVTAQIMEINYNHSEQNISLVISNVINLLTHDEKMDNILYQGISASSSIDVNAPRWDGIDQVTKNVNAIYNNGIAAASINIAAAVNNSVKIDNRGITITDSTDATRYIRMTNGVIGLTKNGIFTTAITPDAVLAPAIVGQLGSFVTLNAASITTGTLSGIAVTIGSGANVFNANPSGISLGAATWAASPFRVDMSGNAWATSMQLSQPSISNGSANGMTLSIGSGSSIFKADTNGIYLGNATFASAPFRVDINGNLYSSSATITGNITATGGSLASLNITGTLSGGTLSGTSILGGSIAIGSGNSILKSDSNGLYLGNATFASAPFRVDMAGAVTASNINITGGNINISNSITIGNTINIATLSGNGGIKWTQLSYVPQIYVDPIGQSLTLSVGAGTGGIWAGSRRLDTGTTTSSVANPDSHNHGFTTSDYFQCYDAAGTPTVKKQWVPYAGSASHSHTT